VHLVGASVAISEGTGVGLVVGTALGAIVVGKAVGAGDGT
jgi:hypothetical protein